MSRHWRDRKPSAAISWLAVALCLALAACIFLAGMRVGERRGLVVAVYVAAPEGTTANAKAIQLPPGTIPGPLPDSLPGVGQ